MGSIELANNIKGTGASKRSTRVDGDNQNVLCGLTRVLVINGEHLDVGAFKLSARQSFLSVVGRRGPALEVGRRVDSDFTSMSLSNQ